MRSAKILWERSRKLGTFPLLNFDFVPEIDFKINLNGRSYPI